MNVLLMSILPPQGPDGAGLWIVGLLILSSIPYFIWRIRRRKKMLKAKLIKKLRSSFVIGRESKW